LLLSNGSQQKNMKEKLEVTAADLRELFHKSLLATAKLKYELMGIGNLNQTHDPLNAMIRQKNQSLNEIKYYKL
jgi:hypothetical protein